MMFPFSLFFGVAVFAFAATALDNENKWHVGTTTTYSENGTILIKSHPSTRKRHHLFLFLSRTNKIVPFKLGDDWTRLAECVKSDNKQQVCWREKDCIQFDEEMTDVNFQKNTYCEEFPDGSSGKDMGTVVFYRKSPKSNPQFTFNLKGKSPTWAILTAVRSRNLDIGTNNVVRDVATESCDKSRQSRFPSTYGKKGDILLLSMAFDDYVPKRAFKAPEETELLGYEKGPGDCGFLYGSTIDKTGETGNVTTKGDGSNLCKDALISLTLMR